MICIIHQICTIRRHYCHRCFIYWRGWADITFIITNIILIISEMQMISWTINRCIYKIHKINWTTNCGRNLCSCWTQLQVDTDFFLILFSFNSIFWLSCSSYFLFCFFSKIIFVHVDEVFNSEEKKDVSEKKTINLIVNRVNHSFA